MAGAFEQAWSLFKARQFRFDAGFRHPDKSARGMAGTFKREEFFTPGPQPGFVFVNNPYGEEYSHFMFDKPLKNRGTLMTETEAESYWPSHISQRTLMAPTMRGLGLDADAAAFRMKDGKYAPPDTDFHEQETADNFTRYIAPVMAHETMHGLDSDISRGSFDQTELPAHILEVATREAQTSREGKYGPEPIIPKAKRLLADRPESGQPPNPDYEFDLTSEPIVAGEPMNLAWRLLKQNWQSTLPYEYQPGVDFKDSFKGLINASTLPPLPSFDTPTKQPSASQILVNQDGNVYTLIGDKGENLSRVSTDTFRNPDKNNRLELHNLYAITNAPYLRQGHYGRLLQGLLSSGRQIVSDERGAFSQPFHEKFSQNLPPYVDLQVFPYRNPRNLKPTPEYDTMYYTPNIPRFKESDLAAYDIGALPMRTEPALPPPPSQLKQTNLTNFQ